MGKFLLRNTILDIILRIEQDSGYSHLLINNEIKKKNISPKDEALLTEIVYGTIERKLTLDYYLSSFIKSNKKLDTWVSVLLRMSVFQMEFLDKVPSYAVIHEAVEIAKQRGHRGIASFVNGVLRNVQRKGVPSTEDIADPIKRLSIETSHPEWLVKRWVAAYGLETTQAICEENLTKRPISVRVQPLRITRDAAMEQLEAEGLTTEKSIFSKQGIIILQGNVLKSSLFKEGLITIQDQSSMLVGEMLSLEPELHVLDTCSAPGGKVTHIAEKMSDKGVIHAYDLHKQKIKLIQEKAKTLQLTSIQVSQNDARKLQSVHEKESFDRIIVDAPCSGLGVVRGKPDIKYSKQEADIERLATIQLDILESVASLLKQDGFLVYSTCTIDRKENEEVVQQFLENHPEFEVDPSFFRELPEEIRSSLGITEWGLQLFPQTFHTDGFFLTRLKKRMG
ncbi:16S rRNA (cytosine(967)-C(5))-methyltransferase RsmB [Ornithinibacillus sp. 4-3]|uniref:16S rRNA (cytosine(967)-C(5))-methyltransferase n=1 Tax=Ornithinibacillus sp. 4-3 TaxID=3231488 RepID=A0AB39HUG2_9BACI